MAKAKKKVPVKAPKKSEPARHTAAKSTAAKATAAKSAPAKAAKPAAAAKAAPKPAAKAAPAKSPAPAKAGKPSKSKTKPAPFEDAGDDVDDSALDLDGGTDEDIELAAEFEEEIEVEEEVEIDDEDEDDDSEVAVEAESNNDEDVILTDAEGNRYCRVRDCDQISTVDGYCRYHYLLLWKKIQVRKKILTDGKLEYYIVELTARYPDKFLEMIRRDLRTQKDFLSAIQELEIDESGLDNDFEEEDTQFIDEVRGLGTAAETESVEDDF